MNDSIIKYPNTPEGIARAVELAGEDGYWEEHVELTTPTDSEEQTADITLNSVVALSAVDWAARQRPEVFSEDTIALVREKLRQHKSRIPLSRAIEVSERYL